MTEEEQKAAQAAEEAKKAEEAAAATKKAEEDKAAADAASAKSGAAGGEDLSKLTTQQLIDRLQKEQSERSKANEEAHKLRTERNDLKKAEEERKRAEMSEVDRLKAEKQDLETRLAQEANQSKKIRIALAASKLGFHDPNDAINMIDLEKLDKDETNLPKLLEDLAKAKPYLVKGTSTSKSPDTGGGNPGGGSEAAAGKEVVTKAASQFSTIKRQIGTQS